MSQPAELIYQIGALRLHPSKRLLLDGEQRVRLGDRALDLLIALVEQAGEVVSKESLFQRVWPRTVVEETSLRVHIAALRKALGDGQDGKRYIANVPGQGYSFISPVTAHQNPILVKSTSAANRVRLPPLPARLTRLIGRTASLHSIARGLSEHRCVTITGAGGIGKTTLALSLAEHHAKAYAGGVVFIELATLTSAAQLHQAVARALGATTPDITTSFDSLADLIGSQPMLMIIDNCEHLVEATAELVVQLLKRTPVLHALSTSREPLRAEGERIHRLDALSIPPAGLSSADAALDFESVQLLVERVSSSMGAFDLSDGDAACAAELCRRLDGVPLAIELAAARVGFFGLQGLRDRLDQRLSLLTSGLRTVLPRHQSLRSLYDWSYDLLDLSGQRALYSLAVFSGAFPLEAALSVIPVEGRARTLAIFLDLISKSLVVVDLTAGEHRYRLMDSTRVYATEKLYESGDVECVHRALASYLIETLEVANAEWAQAARDVWLARHAPLMNDVDTALDWAGSGRGDAVLTARLCAASLQLSHQLSRLGQHRQRLEHALARLATLPERLPEVECQLTATLGVVLGYARAEMPRHDTWLKASAALLKEAQADADVLYVIELHHFTHGEYRHALAAAQALDAVCKASGNAQGSVIARRMQAQIWHFLGDQPRARELAHEVMRFSGSVLRLNDSWIEPMDHQVSMRIVLARIHWLEGDAQGADQLIQEALDLTAVDPGLPRCHVLALAALPIALWRGDHAGAVAHLSQFRQLVEQHAIDFWKEWALGFDWLLQGAAGPTPTLSTKFLDLLGTVSPVLTDERLLARAESGEVGWCAAELLRARGEHLLAISSSHASQAEQLFTRALEMSRHQGLRHWELRAAVSLTRLSLSLGRPHVCAEPLLRVLPRLNAHPSCPEHQLAIELLDQLARPSNDVRAAG